MHMGIYYSLVHTHTYLVIAIIDVKSERVQ